MSPWELRERGGLYYTRSRKEGGCVIREYVGGGVLGDLAARADELRRREREQAVAADREERDTLEALDAPFTQAWEATEILYRAALVAAGYHQHKRGNGGGGVDQKTKKDEDGDLAPARHRELLDQLREVMEGANDGDEEALSKVKAIFKEAPGMARIFADLAGEAERGLIKRLTGGDPLVREALLVRLKAMRKELAGSDPSALERLLAESVVACWLQVQHAEIIYARNLGSMNIGQSEYHQRRLDKLHRRYLSAIKALAQIRKMGSAVQINIADKQINTTG